MKNQLTIQLLLILLAASAYYLAHQVKLGFELQEIELALWLAGSLGGFVTLFALTFVPAAIISNLLAKRKQYSNEERKKLEMRCFLILYAVVVFAAFYGGFWK